MSLTSALNLALAGINASQAKIAVTSGNITNAETAGYTKKTLNTRLITTPFATFPVGGQVVGTRDPFLENALIEDTSSAFKDATIANTLNRFQQLLGSSDGSLSISKAINDLSADLLSLSALPNDPNRKYSLVETAELLTSQIRDVQGGIQDLRQQAEDSIDILIDQANTLLLTIHELNGQISGLNNVSHGNVGDLVDQRFQAISELSKIINIKFFETSDNRITIFTDTGTNLVSSAVKQFNFSPTSGINKGVTYPLNLNPIELNGVDVTGLFNSGELAAQVQLRDTLLVQESQKLDELATQMISTVNAATNQGTALPPVSILTGTEQGFAAGTAVAAAGIVRIATIDANGVVQSFSDINLALSGGTVGGILGQIAAVPGVAAGFGPNGEVIITATNAGEGIAINTMTSDLGPDNRGLSHFFGLNNLFQGLDSRDVDVVNTLKLDPVTFPSGALTSGALAIGDIGVSIGDGSIATVIANSFTAQTTSFNAAGNFTAQTTSVSEYAGSFISNAATRASNAEITSNATNTAYQTMKSTLENQVGINVDEETARLLEMENAFQASAQIISTVRNLFDTLIAAVR